MGIPAKSTEQDFIRLFREHGAAGVARRTGCTAKNASKRRRNLELKYGIVIEAPEKTARGIFKGVVREHPTRVNLAVKDGVVLVGSDAHYWPGIVTAAHRAFMSFCKRFKPTTVIMNGDIIDGSSISRHPPIGWENRPGLQQEIEAASEQLDEIFKATPNAKHIWPLGNHDARFSTRLATVAPEYARVHGVQLKDHFPGWQPCWSVWINDNVVVKHRFKNGIHAAHNNTIASGRSIVTGHLHSLKVTPFDDYDGTRWGVDTGTMADTFGPQFEGYMEDNARNWRSGFALLTFKGGRLLWPEVVHVISEDEVEFRGEIIRV